MKQKVIGIILTSLLLMTSTVAGAEGMWKAAQGDRPMENSVGLVQMLLIMQQENAKNNEDKSIKTCANIKKGTKKSQKEVEENKQCNKQTNDTKTKNSKK